MPDTVESVHKNALTKWNISLKLLLQRALANLEHQYKPEVSYEQVSDVFSLYYFFGEHFYVASYALLLSKNKDYIGKYGSLVAIPNRHILLCYPINDVKIFDALPEFIQLTDFLYNEGPGSITNNVYWLHNDNFRVLAYTLDEKSLDFNPPKEFQKILDQLNSQDDVNY